MASINFSIMKLVVWAILFSTSKAISRKPTRIPAIFTFGDSTLDTGNNNYISTVAKSNFPPYGQDLPDHNPTGRFSNGKLISDFFATELGIKEFIPPFLDPKLSDKELTTGVSFASGGSGFDELSCLKTRAISMAEQLQLFKNYISRLNGIVGKKKAQRIIRNALVFITAGPNDWILNYYDFPTIRSTMNVTSYTNFLLDKAHNFFEEIYDIGCRRIVVTSLPPMGCLPVQRMTFKTKKCINNENGAAQSYNRKLHKLLHSLEAEHPDGKFLYVDSYHRLLHMIHFPQKYGFVETTRGCWAASPFNINPNSKAAICKKSSEFLFWDTVHLTQAAYHHLSISMGKVIFPKLLKTNWSH